MFGHETLGVIINTNYQSSMKILSENSSNSSSGCGGQGGGGNMKLTLTKQVYSPQKTEIENLTRTWALRVFNLGVFFANITHLDQSINSDSSCRAARLCCHCTLHGQQNKTPEFTGLKGKKSLFQKNHPTTFISFLNSRNFFPGRSFWQPPPQTLSEQQERALRFPPLHPD